MNKSIDIRKGKWIGYALSACFLLIHAALLVLFSFFGVTPMAFYNVFSILLYIASFFMLRSGNVWLYSVSVHLEVVIHMALAVCLVGLNSGFQVAIIGMNAFAFYAEYTSVSQKKRRVSAMALCGFGMFAYLFAVVYGRFVPPPYALSEDASFWQQIAWGIIVFAISGFFLQMFVTAILRSERSFQVVQTLTEAIDDKDKYTNGHSGRVANYAREIARRAGMSEKDQNEIFIMGLVHDVGKIGVPDAVINKPGRLSDEEFGKIKTHTDTGERILEKIEEMPELSVGAHLHHERIAGKGYPGGLKGEEIPIEARIIAVADSYDAMTSNRSYREAMPQSRVREEIEKGIGTQFDPKYAKIMLDMIDEDKDYTMREI